MARIPLVIGTANAGSGDTPWQMSTNIELNFVDLYNNKSDISHTHAALDITGFQTTVSANTDVADNTSKAHESTDSDTIVINTGSSTDYLSGVGTYVATTNIDHDTLTNFVLGEHRLLTDVTQSATTLWSSNKIISSRIVEGIAGDESVITVGIGGDGVMYTDLATALTYAGTIADSANKVAVDIFPGTYVGNFTIPNYVTIRGHGGVNGQVHLTSISGTTLTLPTGSGCGVKHLKISTSHIDSGTALCIPAGCSDEIKISDCGIYYNKPSGYSTLVDIQSGSKCNFFACTFDYTSTGDTVGSNNHEVISISGTNLDTHLHSCHAHIIVEDSTNLDSIFFCGFNSSSVITPLFIDTEIHIVAESGCDVVVITFLASNTSQLFIKGCHVSIYGDSTSGIQISKIYDIDTNTISVMSTHNIFREFNVALPYFGDIDTNCSLISHYDGTTSGENILGSGTYIRSNSDTPGELVTEKIKILEDLYFFKDETSLLVGQSKTNILSLNNITGATGGELSILEATLQAQNANVEVNAIKTTEGIKPIKQQLGETVSLTSLYISPETPASYTASTISFHDSGPDTIDDSANLLSVFSQDTIINVDSVSNLNDGDYYINAAVTGAQIILHGLDTLSSELVPLPGEVIITETLEERLSTFGEAFHNNDDYIYIGVTSGIFDIITVDLTTPSSANITPIFEYSAGAGSWTSFTPVDNTNGFTNSGLIILPTLASWAKNVLHVGETDAYYIRISRTRNNLVTNPDINGISVELSTTSSHEWDENGLLKIKTYSQNAEPTNGDDVASGQIPIGKFGFWIDTDGGDALYLIFNQAGTIKKLTFT